MATDAIRLANTIAADVAEAEAAPNAVEARRPVEPVPLAELAELPELPELPELLDRAPHGRHLVASITRHLRESFAVWRRRLRR